MATTNVLVTSARVDVRNAADNAREDERAQTDEEIAHWQGELASVRKALRQTHEELVAVQLAQSETEAELAEEKREHGVTKREVALLRAARDEAIAEAEQLRREAKRFTGGPFRQQYLDSLAKAQAELADARRLLAMVPGLKDELATERKMLEGARRNIDVLQAELEEAHVGIRAVLRAAGAVK